MKTVSFVPSVCKGDGATFEGSIVVRFPTFDEKFDYIEQLQVVVNDDGSVEGDQKAKLKSIREMVKLSAKHYVEVSLKRKADGEEFKSFDDMQYADDLHAVLVEVAGMMINGFKVGNG